MTWAMSKPISKSKAIMNVLGRLGFHAKASEVVAALREYGIVVSEGLVQKVKIGILKDTSGIRRQSTKMQQAAQPAARRLVRTVPGRG